MNKLLVYSICIIAICTVSCAAKTVSKKSLKKPVVVTQLELPTDYLYDKSGIYIDSAKVKGSYYYGVTAGKYVAEYEDKNGIYYRGLDRPVILYGSNSKGEKSLVPGGIWLPKEGKKYFRPYWYSYVGPENQSPQSQPPKVPLVDPQLPGTSTAVDITGAVVAGAIVQTVIDSDKNNVIFLPKPPLDMPMIDTFEKNIKVSAVK